MYNNKMLIQEKPNTAHKIASYIIEACIDNHEDHLPEIIQSFIKLFKFGKKHDNSDSNLTKRTKIIYELIGPLHNHLLFLGSFPKIQRLILDTCEMFWDKNFPLKNKFVVQTIPIRLD